MTYLTSRRNATHRVSILIGLVLLLWGVSACGSIIEVVPYTPTPGSPTPTSQVSAGGSITAVGTPAQIEAQTIGLDSPVVEMGWRVVERDGQPVSEWEMPDDEAGWHRNTARPGEGSNVVISGHNASTGGQVFAELEELQVGDEITLWNDSDESFVYQVTEKTIVRTFAISDEADEYLRTVTEPTPQEQLTLISCWPRWSNTHRLIVIAQPKL